VVSKRLSSSGAMTPEPRLPAVELRRKAMDEFRRTREPRREPPPFDLNDVEKLPWRESTCTDESTTAREMLLRRRRLIDDRKRLGNWPTASPTLIFSDALSRRSQASALRLASEISSWFQRKSTRHFKVEWMYSTNMRVCPRNTDGDGDRDRGTDRDRQKRRGGLASGGRGVSRASSASGRAG
jgi:hypothetical protein